VRVSPWFLSGWYTIEKEVYAIYWAFTKLVDLLGGIRFTIRTDHRNLLYLNNHGSRKFLQWKLDIQHYDAIIEHFPGEQNIPADVFSRLVQNPAEASVHQILILQCTDAQWSMIKENHEWMHAHSGVDRTILHLTQRYPIETSNDNCPIHVRMFANISKVASHIKKWRLGIKSFEHRDMLPRL